MRGNALIEMPEVHLRILGTDRRGTRLAVMFAHAGRRVLLSSHDPHRARAVARDLGAGRIISGGCRQALEARALLPAMFIRNGQFDVPEGRAAALEGKLRYQQPLQLQGRLFRFPHAVGFRRRGGSAAAAPAHVAGRGLFTHEPAPAPGAVPAP